MKGKVYYKHDTVLGLQFGELRWLHPTFNKVRRCQVTHFEGPESALSDIEALATEAGLERQ